MKKRVKWVVFMLIAVLMVQSICNFYTTNFNCAEINENTEETHLFKVKKDPLLSQKDWDFNLGEKLNQFSYKLFIQKNELVYNQHYSEVHIPPPKV